MLTNKSAKKFTGCLRLQCLQNVGINNGSRHWDP